MDDELKREQEMRLQGAQDSAEYVRRITMAIGIIERRYHNHWERQAYNLIAAALLGKEYNDWLKKMMADDRRGGG